MTISVLRLSFGTRHWPALLAALLLAALAFGGSLSWSYREMVRITEEREAACIAYTTLSDAESCLDPGLASNSLANVPGLATYCRRLEVKAEPGFAPSLLRLRATVSWRSLTGEPRQLARERLVQRVLTSR